MTILLNNKKLNVSHERHSNKVLRFIKNIFKTSSLELKLSRENERVTLPTKRSEDAGYDLYIDPQVMSGFNGVMYIPAHSQISIPLGIRSSFNKNWYIQFLERGSTGMLGMKYSSGVIDSGFRGVWNFCLKNSNEHALIIYDDSVYTKEQLQSKFSTAIFYPSSKAIGQFVILPVPSVEIKEVSIKEIMKEKSSRMEGKYGSSGK